MTKTIIEMARETGIEVWRFDLQMRLERFAELVAAHEREECAKLCEDHDDYGCQHYADAIRARGKA